MCLYKFICECVLINLPILLNEDFVILFVLSFTCDCSPFLLSVVS